MPAEVLRLIDEGIIPRFNALFGSGGSSVEVVRAYGTKWKLAEYTGRHLDIYPMAYGSGESATRREDFYEEVVTLAFHERYTDVDAVPDAWMDERMLFVETQIFDPLTATRNPYRVEIGSGNHTVTYWCETAEVSVAYDWMMYDQHKVFWSEIECTFRRLR